MTQEQPVHHHMSEADIIHWQEEQFARTGNPGKSAPPSEILSRNDYKFNTAGVAQEKTAEERKRQEDKVYQSVILKARQKAIEEAGQASVQNHLQAQAQAKAGQMESLITLLTQASPEQVDSVRKLLGVKTR